MKTIRKTYVQLVATVFISGILVYGCKKSSDAPNLDASKLSSICDGKIAAAKEKGPTGEVTVTTGTLPYTVSFLKRLSNGDGTYTWIWSVTNPKPGNGKNGTVQDLSHWGLSLGTCAKITDIVGAGTSTDGTKWTSFSPDYKVDKSQSCSSSPILKFDVGTKDSKTTFYKLIVKGNFASTKVSALYKSGNNTGCGVFEICGLGCVK